MTEFTTHIVEDLTTGKTHRFKSLKDAQDKIQQISKTRPMVKGNNEYQPKLYTVDEYMELKGIA